MTKVKKKNKYNRPTFSYIEDLSYINGEYVRKLRLNMNITRTNLAEYLGVSYKTIESWENGHNKIIGPAQKLLYLIDDDPTILNKFKKEYINDVLVRYQKSNFFDWVCTADMPEIIQKYKHFREVVDENNPSDINGRKMRIIELVCPEILFCNLNENDDEDDDGDCKL